MVRRMKRWIVGFGAVVAGFAASAHAAVWQPLPGHTQVPIWPAAVSDTTKVPGPEESGPVKDHLVAGRPWTFLNNVSRPTLTVYSPKGRAGGAAVIVFPGGGYQTLAIDLEGTEICDWLTSKGVTCVLSKYRVPNSGPTWEQFCGCNPKTRSSRPLEDAQRTISLVRYHAKEWHIDPKKIGVIGFSAGGHLVAAVSTRFDHRVYPAMDAADKESCRPDFAMAVYPGHLFDYNQSALNQDLHITRDTPPTFLVHAENDPVDGVSNTLAYYDELKNAGVPVEMHLYAEGGHAFGLRPTKDPITRWPALAETWLRTIGMVP
jgi:acetyl esterase/lipase